MLQRRTIITAAAGLLLLAVTPVRAADTASPNDTARFLAGMPVAPESPLAPLTKDGSWQQHARSFDGAFGRLEQGQLARIRAWSEKNITAPPPTVFYMFSGPDFLYVNAFYPNAKTYVLAGLEPVGTVPDLTTLRGSLSANLYHMHGSISSLLSHTFFITHKMRSDLNVGRVNGTLPILYVFLARSGKTVREVSLVRIDEQGAVQPDAGGARGSAARGVKIVFTGSDDEPRTLYYFSTNLADDGVKSSKFLQFLETLAPGDGLVKSASYLLHSGGFTKVRDFLVANCSAMVQDDSGVPLRYYDPKKWDFHPFGRYLGPIGVFPGRYQANYAVLFRNSRPIDFGIGYRWRSNESNLLLAVKKPEAAAPEASLRPAIEEPAPAATAESAAVNDPPAPQHQGRRYVRRGHRTFLDWFRAR
ncbi:MAG TPA: hypothetical protein VH678_23990 [Xanthobacteraceae bacterium]|jgi:hypothetical protein